MTDDRKQGAEDSVLDPVLAALFDRLPEAGVVWPEKERARWLAALGPCFDLVYGAREAEE